jgi:hypothetical protein
MKRIRAVIRAFFFPPVTAARWIRILPYALLGALTLSVLVGSAYAWDYTNSPPFCGTSCHTMPPEYAAYQVSPHARIACVECHIGREFIGNQVMRKAGDIKHIVALAFTTYQFPITADDMRPARETCERCHSPEKFSDDSLVELRHFGGDIDNTPTSIYLTLRTGGGTKREGLGRGIHWHIQNRVMYYPTDKTEQTIPYVKVYNDDGSVDQYVDVSAKFDPAAIADTDLKQMDCITCHNRITHMIYSPEDSVDQALTHGTIDSSIPEIKLKGVQALTGPYASQQKGFDAIAGLADFYQRNYPDYYAAHADLVGKAVAELRQIYADSVFPEQKADWTSHPSNVGHKDTPGCFRCHDGKHMNAKQQAIRLECNLCHSIPVTASKDQFLVNIEISRGPEPESHKNSNWIGLHRQSLDQTCTLCHTTGNPGGTDNSSFCSNSACHGSAWKYAGLDAPALTTILLAQMPTPTPTPTTAPTPIGGPSPTATRSGPVTYTADVQAILESRCSMCHGKTAAGGLMLMTYEGIMKGGKNGLVITPGQPANSRLVEIQSNKHFANLTSEELALIKAWIEAGALEK